MFFGGRTRRKRTEVFAGDDAESFDPLLLAEGDGDEVAKLDEFGLGEVLVELNPQGVVGEIGIPDDGAGPHQSNFFALGESV